MIVLKHLAREFNLDPHALRKILRDNFKIPKGRRWAYEDKSKELKDIRKFLSTKRQKLSLPPATLSRTSTSSAKSVSKKSSKSQKPTGGSK